MGEPGIHVSLVYGRVYAMCVQEFFEKSGHSRRNLVLNTNDYRYAPQETCGLLLRWLMSPHRIVYVEDSFAICTRVLLRYSDITSLLAPTETVRGPVVHGSPLV